MASSSLSISAQEMTLDEYEKILEEKKKALSSSKGEERKVKADKAFESMHLVDRKNDNDVFIKLVWPIDHSLFGMPYPSVGPVNSLVILLGF